nr:TMEM175 family protein [Rhodococcus sp. (in: high G+C Gram-positive bacteria)]
MDTQRGFERLVNFSDAVVAIAATLLVLPLVDIADPDAGTGTWDLLGEHAAEIFAFVLSFVVIFRLWLTHHRLFQDVVGYTRPMTWANFLWLLSIVFLPFPTKLIAEKSGFDPSASSLYVGTILVANLAICIIALIVARRPELARPGSDVHLAETLITSGLMIVALGLSFTVVGLWSIAALTLTGPIHRIVDLGVARSKR